MHTILYINGDLEVVYSDRECDRRRDTKTSLKETKK